MPSKNIFGHWDEVSARSQKAVCWRVNREEIKTNRVLILDFSPTCCVTLVKSLNPSRILVSWPMNVTLKMIPFTSPFLWDLRQWRQTSFEIFKYLEHVTLQNLPNHHFFALPLASAFFFKTQFKYLRKPSTKTLSPTHGTSLKNYLVLSLLLCKTSNLLLAFILFILFCPPNGHQKFFEHLLSTHGCQS